MRTDNRDRDSFTNMQEGIMLIQRRKSLQKNDHGEIHGYHKQRRSEGRLMETERDTSYLALLSPETLERYLSK